MMFSRPFAPRLPLAIVGLAAVSLAGCQTPPSPAYPSQPLPPVAERPDPLPVEREEDEFVNVPQQQADGVVRVGLLLPFTNERENIETIAEAMLKAAQMVSFESQNERYLLIPKDTQGTDEGARLVAEEVIREGADIILGPLLSSSTKIVSEIAQPYNIPVIAFSSDSEAAGPGTYLLSFPPEAEIARVTDYAIENGYAHFGLMAPMTDFGNRVSAAFENEVFDRGGDLVHTERYEPSADAMIPPARRMARYAARRFEPVYVSPRSVGYQGQDSSFRSSDDGYRYQSEPQPAAVSASQYQAVLLPEQGRLLRALAPLFPYNNVNIREVKLLGLSGWNNPLLTREPALNGGWFAAPDPTLSEGFKRRYEKAYGSRPPRLASLAYDAALLTARLSELPPGEQFTTRTIANPNGYLGADGLFRLRPDGMVERGLAVLEIRPSGIQVIDPAPRRFEAGFTGIGY